MGGRKWWRVTGSHGGKDQAFRSEDKDLHSVKYRSSEAVREMSSEKVKQQLSASDSASVW